MAMPAKRKAGAAEPVAKDVMARCDMVVARLSRLAQDEVSKRRPIEDGWLEDTRQHEGIYEPEVIARLRENERSEMFANVTRTHTNAWKARIGDMMFPSDDKNWEITPTPDPDLAEAANVAAEGASRAAIEATEAQQQGGPEAAAPIVAKGNKLAQQAALATSVMDEADKRCTGMDRAIDDQLTEAGYAVQARKAIADATRLGSGILKGPLISNRPKRRWMETAAVVADPDKGVDPTPGFWSLTADNDPAPQSLRVNPWNFFPEGGAATFSDCEYLFERHLPNPSKLRAMRDLPGFSRKAINDVLAAGPTEPLPTYLDELRSLNGETQNASLSKRFIVWEYHGPVTGEEMRDLITVCKPNGWEDWLAQVEESEDDSFNVVVWFCQNKLLKFADWPNDSGDFIYDVFPFIERPDCGPLGGIGVPRVLRDPQAAFAGAWRMTLDNAALSSGPQMLIDKSAIAPADGSWKILPRKVWHVLKSLSSNQQAPFQQFNIANNSQDLVNVITLARDFADEEASLPDIAKGEQGEHVTPTMGGMAILMGSANVVFRECVRSWDDHITARHIGRYFDWNMQHNPDDRIKGDMRVVARGTSVLLAKAAESATLVTIAERWTVHPVLGALIDAPKAAMAALRALSVSPESVLKSELKAKADAIAAANSPPEPSPQQITAEAMVKRAEIDSKSRLEVAEISREVAMQDLAAQYNMSIDKLRALLDTTKIKADSTERTFAAKVAVDQRKDMAAAASVPGAAGGGEGIA